ncbi:MAG: hypothetical protein LBC42_01410 [Puniceicoccales bacterium]|nr:hypothetical protein [Puniceicoccales bacterium]
MVIALGESTAKFHSQKMQAMDEEMATFSRAVITQTNDASPSTKTLRPLVETCLLFMQ